MKGYCSLNMHVDVAASWLYMLYYSVAVYYFFFHFAILLLCAQNAKNAIKTTTPALTFLYCYVQCTSGLLLVAVHLFSLRHIISLKCKNILKHAYLK